LTAKAKPSEVERLEALVEAKLSDLKRQLGGGEVPSTSELNAVRRLVTWLEGEREIARVRALTSTGPSH
jgi:hypothetical protein